MVIIPFRSGDVVNVFVIEDRLLEMPGLQGIPDGLSTGAPSTIRPADRLGTTMRLPQHIAPAGTFPAFGKLQRVRSVMVTHG
jgi:hypothetical protein